MTMKSARKWMVWLAVVCLCGTMLVPAAAEEAVDPYGPVSEERVVISVGREESANVAYDPGESSEDNYIVRYLEEKLNVDYQYAFSADSATYQTKVAMALASGDMPDVMNVNYRQLAQLVDAEAVEDMTDAFAKYKSPSLTVCFESTDGLAEALATFNGRLMAIGNVAPGMDSVPLIWLRKDWLEAVGLEAPSTWDEVVNVASAFISQNPSGKVTTGIAASNDYYQPGGGSYHLNALFTYFGAYPEQWVADKDGQTVYGSVTEETKTALAAIRELIASGIVNPSLATTNGDQCYELIANDQSGMWFGSWWNGQWPVVNIMGGMSDSASFMSVLAPLSSANGKMNVVGRSPTDTYVIVKKGASEDVKEAVVKTINYQYDLDQSQAEGVRPKGMDSNFSWHYYPINVLHCDYDAKEKQIDAVMEVIAGTREYDDQCGDGKTWYNGYTAVLEKGFRAAYQENLATANAWGWATGAWEVQRNSELVNIIPAACYAETESMERLWGAMLTLEEEYFLKVLTGESSLDGWDAFVAEWNAIGGERVTQDVRAYVGK